MRLFLFQALMSKWNIWGIAGPMALTSAVEGYCKNFNAKSTVLLLQYEAGGMDGLDCDLERKQNNATNIEQKLSILSFKLGYPISIDELKLLSDESQKDKAIMRLARYRSIALHLWRSNVLWNGKFETIDRPKSAFAHVVALNCPVTYINIYK